MTRPLFRVILCLAPLSVFGSPVQGQTSKTEGLVTFCVMGDTPYENYENQLLPLQIAGLPADIPFAIHVGDIKRGGPPCDDPVYRKVSGMLAKSRAPIFIIPGDNEYNDCSDPPAAWKLWTAHFAEFDKRWKHDLDVTRQPDRGENFAFVRNRVLFLGVHVLGGRVHDPEEWKRRHADDLRWIEKNFQDRGAAIEAAVLFGHATPTGKQADFFGGLKKSASEFGKPMVYIHGDSHRFVRYQPFPEVKNLHAIQIDRGGIAPPIRVTVTPGEVEPFQVDRRFEARVADFPRNEGEAKARAAAEGG